MKRIIIAVIAIVALLVGAYYAGVLPVMDMLGPDGYETQANWHNNFQGNPDKELFLPEDRKGFITSYRSDLLNGLSETIVVSGRYKFQVGTSSLNEAKYVIKWKANPSSDWVIVSRPGYTVNWISVGNPGDVTSGYAGLPGIRQCDPYVFNIRGQREGAIRAELWGYMDPNEFNPFDTWEWKLLSSDQALLHSGVCGMWLPAKSDGGYQSTFEIDEKVNIKVETGVGAPDINVGAGGNTWELHLIKPDGFDYTGQGFPMKLADHYQGTISFTVNENMVTIGPGSNNRYKLQLYNALWKKGTLEISTIDFRAKMPGKPTITPDCGLDIKVPGTVAVTISATPNADTQLPIESFGVMVWYGKHNDLAPGSWGEERWILHQTFISASKSGDTYTGSFSFTVGQPNLYVTIIAYTHDTDGRDSDTEYYQIKTWDETAPDDDDLIAEGGGQGSYGGGTSGMTTPWDFHWDDTEVVDYIALIVAIAIFVIMLIIALMPTIPIPYGMYGRLIVVALGAALAVLTYWYMGGEF